MNSYRLAAAATAFLLMVRPAVGSAGTVTDWPQSFHDAGHTGFNSKETVLSVSNVPGLQLRWGQSVAGGVTSFALNGGVIYAQGQGDGGNNPNLAAIDADSGATLWTVTTGHDGVFSGTIATDSNHIFAGCSFTDGTGNTSGAICAYRKSNGKLVWHYANPCDCLPESGVQSPPVYSKGVVYFGYAYGGAGGPEYVVAADAATGSVIWTYGTGSSNTLGTTAPTVAGGDIYFACAGNNFAGICAVSQANGTLIWSANIGTAAIGLTANNGVLYVNAAGPVYETLAFDGATGAEKWSYGAGDYTASNLPVAVAKGVVYATDTYDQLLFAIDAQTGALKWSGALGVNSSATVANGVVYIDGGCCSSGTNPAASAYKASNGKELWAADHPQSTLNPGVIVANGTVYITNAPCGSVCAYRPQ